VGGNFFWSFWFWGTFSREFVSAVFVFETRNPRTEGLPSAVNNARDNRITKNKIMHFLCLFCESLSSFDIDMDYGLGEGHSPPKKAFLEHVLLLFLNSPYRETRKSAIKMTEGNPILFWVDNFLKSF
jgi:hypothetical protein